MSSFEWVQLSPDGSAGWCGRRKHQVVSHRDHLYLLGGYAAEANISRNLNDIWRSSNGKNWSQIVSHAPWSGRDGHAALEHLGYIYLMGGTQDVHSNDDDVWRSSNAINWVQLCRSAGWEGRWQHAAVSHDGSIYLMGGWSAESDYMDDIWRSTDGTRWTCICHHAEWGPRMFHVLVSLNGAIYLMGGAHRSTYNDVWVSTDGCSWQRLIREAQWCPRTGHAAVVHENHIFLCGGGAPDGTTLNDMWHSMDGAHWSVVTTGPNSAIWTPRRGHAVVSHSNSIFIFGGCSAMVDVNDENQGERQYMNDCYRTLTDIELLWSSEEAEYRDQTGRVDVVLAPVNESSLVENRGLGSAIIGSALPPGTTSSIKVGARQGNLGINNITVGMRTVVDGVSALMQRRKELRNVQLTTLKIAKRTEDAILLAFPEIEATDNAESTLEDLNSLETSVSALRSFVEQKRQELKDIHCKIRGTVKDWKSVDVVDLLIEQRTEIAKISLPHIEKLAGCMNDVVLRQNESHAFLEEAIIYLEEVAKTLGGEVWVKIQRLLGNDSSALPVITNKKDLSLHYKELIESIKDDSMEPLNRKTDEALNQLTISAKDVSKSLSEVTAWIECVNEGEMLSIGSAAELDEAERVLSQVRLEAHWQVDSELHSIPHLLERKKELNMDLMVTAHQHLTALLTCAKARTSELDLQAQNLASWANLVRQWADADGLAQKCKDLIERIQSTKERLLDLEDKAQDCRSNMHKRRRRDAPADEISQLQLDLKHAQLAVAYAQRLKRRLASEISALAHSTAPEIAVQVPDAINFLSRTTQEIEGVSVSGLGLPIRSLSEYENIKPMDESENRTRGRHQMFTATLDDEKVALKCYALVGSGERRALERELSILARIRHGAIIRANALIEAPNLLMEDGAVPVMYIEFPYCAQGSLKTWISASRREQWEIQSIFRQVLCGVMYLHEKCVIHKDIKPENILLHADGRVLLADFDISRDAPDDSADTFQPVSTNTSMRGGGTRGFMAPEVEAGGTATRASDMYSLGCVLFWMHFPDHPTGPIAGTHIRAPAREAPAVAALELMHQLLSVDPSRRPGASDALLHSYFRISFVDRLLEEGAVPGQHAKLSAVRALFARIRDDSQHENIVRWSIRRGLLTLVQDVFSSLERMYGSYLRRPIKVTFEGEAGVDEGGMFNETMTLFFQGILHPHFELFESSESGQVNSEAENNGAFRAYSSRYLPTPREECSDTALKYYYLIGQAISLCLYRGNRIGEAFASSLFRYLAGDRPSAATLGDLEQWDSATAAGLQWLLACKSVAVKGLKLSFDDIGLPGGAVTSENRLQYVQAKIQKMLVASRESALSAIRAGTISSLTALSPEAPDLMNLLGPADWRVLLCGEAHISGAQVASAITYNGFPHQSGILQWLPALVQSLNEDTLRQFLVFVCGSPSLPAEGSITVRCQPSSPALPVAHTCFMHLDLPDYPSEGVLRYKLLQAISESGTFDIV